ncbi:MAG TPA: TMEM175 family protein [Methanothrix sp.]|nr:TMEM175 family protein [Methanothrix sp.]HPJ83704.1 TMEM175 family protein [Methanothrix sp.]
MTSTDSDVPGMTTHRIEALTDGIFAVAMTLLVLNLKLPQGGVEGMEADLIDLVTGQSHVFSNYAMSFLLAAVFWIIHHQQSHFIKRTDRNHIWLNVIILMFVSLIPFSTSLINDYHDDWMASIFFGMNMFILGSLFYLNWDYATRGHRLVALSLDPRRIAVGKRRSAVTPIVSLLAMALALVDAPISSLAYLLIPVILFHPTFRYNSEKA